MDVAIITNGADSGLQLENARQMLTGWLTTANLPAILVQERMLSDQQQKHQIV